MKALITGITGQDGSYLAELLLSKGYEVHGTIRRASTPNLSRIDHLLNQVTLHHCDLLDSPSINSILDKVRPDEIYNLAAQSHVKVSFTTPEYSANVAGLGPLRILEGIRQLKLESRFYQASSSEMFGKVIETPQKETTPFYPRSPYACGKVMGHNITVNYRESYGIFACNGILFNHESPRRGADFVTQKIVLAAKRIKASVHNFEPLVLGNLDAKRDWMHAKDAVNAMWLMLQVDEPDDYVVGSGETHSVREFCEKTFLKLGIGLKWFGEGVAEIGHNLVTGTLVKVSQEFFRPCEVELLLSDPSKIEEKLGWKREYSFDDLVEDMVTNS
jgi:GDPmannose 4,6-dehydratase